MQVSRGYDAQTTGTNRNAGNVNTQHHRDDEDENVFNNATDTIELDTAMLAWRLADENQDGVVDRQEMANAAYQLLNNDDATEEEKALGNMFATMVLGGTDGLGLDPHDSAISATDMRLLAGADGEGDSFSADDFKTVMGDRVNPDGNEFSMDDLLQIAQGQDGTSPTNPSQPAAPPQNPYYPPASGPVPPVATPPAQQPPPGMGYPTTPPATTPPATTPPASGNDLNSMMVQFMQSIIQMLMQLLQVMGGGAGQRTVG